MLALIDRNFQGFGKELFTDAGKYVIHFGQEPQEAAEQVNLHNCNPFQCHVFCIHLLVTSVTIRLPQNCIERQSGADASMFMIKHGTEFSMSPCRASCAGLQVSNTIAAAHPDKPRPAPPVTALAKMRTDVQVVPTQTGNQLVRPLCAVMTTDPTFPTGPCVFIL